MTAPAPAAAGYLDSYTGPLYDEDGRRCGFVQNADITDRVRDAYLEHFTVRSGYGVWHLTRVAEEPPAPLVIEARGARHEVRAVSVARSRSFGARGGYEVGYYTGDQVIARVDTPGMTSVYHVYRRYDPRPDWRRATPEMTAEEYAAWNGETITLGSTEKIPALIAWLAAVPAPPNSLCLLPEGHPLRRSPGF
ncbi:hypothetical protein [Micromonospora sp. WMMD737]|uniref:hypothetical protein n=1 Tax=Micromonospora sp. WMMD737 TaxID=3404113 RepID=UPI003B950223